MLKFLVYQGDEPATHWPLRNCYMLGADGNAMRCDIAFENGMIVCDKRESGSAALCLQHAIGDLGQADAADLPAARSVRSRICCRCRALRGTG